MLNNDKTIKALWVILLAAILLATPCCLEAELEGWPEGDYFKVSSGDAGENLLTMDFKNADLRNVLRLLAEQNGLNIVAGPDVAGQVTVRLHGVTVDEALRNILKANDYAFSRDENVILVKPGENKVPPKPREVGVFDLRYVDGADVKKAVEGILTEGGKVQTFRRTMGGGEEAVVQSEVLIVNDQPHVIRDVEKIISRIDVPEPQVMIEARIVEALFNKNDQVGIAWPNTLQLLYSKLSIEEKYQSGSSSTSGTSEKVGSFFKWGMLSGKDLQGAIDILSQETNSKLISNPRITTLNNQEAEIAVTTSVPIQTVNRFSFAAESQDVASFEYIDIGITLKVTPRVNEGKTITMQVEPTIEEISGYSGPVEYQVPITTKRSSETSIRVKDGETIVIGGLLKENRGETVSKLWLLGDIPLLGRLFSHKSLKEERSDLLIFITPHIING